MPKRVENAKIACLDFSLQKAKMHLGVSVVVEDPEKLEAIRKRYVVIQLPKSLQQPSIIQTDY